MTRLGSKHGLQAATLTAAVQLLSDAIHSANDGDLAPDEGGLPGSVR
jgi:hypothetical protein